MTGETLTNEQLALNNLRDDVEEMMESVLSQLRRAHSALKTCDKDLAQEILTMEKKINSIDLRLDKSCESILALYNPLAVNLRFTMAVMSISAQLERIGDHASDLAEYIDEETITEPYDEEILKKVKLTLTVSRMKKQEK